MGALYEGQPPSMIQDLKVTVHGTSTIIPALPTPRRSMFLSNIDQVLNFDVQTVHFFGPNHDHSPDEVARKLKDALSRILVYCDFLAGRLATDPESGRLVFDCNSAGVGFVVASSEYRLDDIGDLVYPNPAFEQLVTRSISPDDKPLGIFQVPIATLSYPLYTYNFEARALVCENSHSN